MASVVSIVRVSELVRLSATSSSEN